MYLSRRLLEYWSQNQHIQLRFDVRPASPGDPPGYQSGTNVWVNVFDTNHWVIRAAGTRSRGFIWFFSFLAWFFHAKKLGKPMLLLLDEPGVFLHATAQRDLLRFIETELNACHQVIYTTHSPFMIDAGHFERIRIACELGMKEGTIFAARRRNKSVFGSTSSRSREPVSPARSVGLSQYEYPCERQYPGSVDAGRHVLHSRHDGSAGTGRENRPGPTVDADTRRRRRDRRDVRCAHRKPKACEFSGVDGVPEEGPSSD